MKKQCHSDKSDRRFKNRIINILRRILLFSFLVLPLFVSMKPGEAGLIQNKVAPEIEFLHDTSAKKIDILLNGTIFTSFLYADSFEKPVFYPVFAPGGVPITRGYPLDPKQGERIDHPHHTGLWFNYGKVNSLDFWNNSKAIPEKKRCAYGTITCLEDSIKISKEDGSLQVVCLWVNCTGEILLAEKTLFLFTVKTPYVCSMERITHMTAIADSIIFDDSKEGLLGIRVARPFEMPSAKPCVLYDTAIGITGKPRVDSTGVNGLYYGSNGLSGTSVWGTRNRWVLLSGVSRGDSISIAMIDHPQNPGFPSYWHAREYGLFSVNNLGVRSYDPAQTKTCLKLKKNESVTFRHLLLVKSGGFLLPADMEKQFRAFSEDSIKF